MLHESLFVTVQSEALFNVELETRNCNDISEVKRIQAHTHTNTRLCLFEFLLQTAQSRNSFRQLFNAEKQLQPISGHKHFGHTSIGSQLRTKIFENLQQLAQQAAWQRATYDLCQHIDLRKSDQQQKYLPHAHIHT